MNTIQMMDGVQHRVTLDNKKSYVGRGTAESNISIFLVQVIPPTLLQIETKWLFLILCGCLSHPMRPISVWPLKQWFLWLVDQKSMASSCLIYCHSFRATQIELLHGDFFRHQWLMVEAMTKISSNYSNHSGQWTANTIPKTKK